MPCNDQLICLGQATPATQYPSSSWQYLQSFPDLISVDSLWQEMDRVWDETFAKHNKQYSDAFFAEYYSHPVWALNSVFSGIDRESVRNRVALIDCLKGLGVSSVVDMGGGYGTFLRLVKSHLPSLELILCEPYLDESLEEDLQDQGIATSRQIPAYADVYTFIDVLEHLTDPLGYLSRIVKTAQPDSLFIFGNCFYPVIKCHLPSTFYLRHTFSMAARLLGLQYISQVKGAEYMEIYKHKGASNISPKLVKVITKPASSIFASLQIGSSIARKIKRFSPQQ
jgi:2-polyprenyl-6-hydroxyphenyl methylase/3-demethylubiquinone-9 3-methyltransferase